MARVFRSVLPALVLTAALGATNARADIDATGFWSVTYDLIGPIYQHWVQTGSTLVIDGATGSINPVTGDFSISFPPTAGDPCQPEFSTLLGGTVAPDGQTFTGLAYVCGDSPSSCCALGGPVSFNAMGDQISVVCGNGILEGPESCDDGNTTSGDGCDANCQVEPCHHCSGQPSTCSTDADESFCDDGNLCTLNACNATGSCVVTGLMPAGTTCEYGHLCTESACDSAGTCVVTDNNCDDGNPCTVDQCVPTVGCEHMTLPFSIPCFPDPCTVGTCNGATCEVLGPNDCNDGDPCTADSCDPQLGCQHTSDVRSCRSAQATRLVIKDGATASKDKRLWKWAKGDATVLSDFGTPTTTTSYTLCVFAGTTAAIVGEAGFQPSAQTWSAIGQRGFKYKEPGGVFTNMTLLSGPAGKAKIILKGKGVAAPTEPPYPPPLTIQLTNSSTNACWSSTFDAADVKRNATGMFSAKAK